MDVALAIEYLVPTALYYGSLTDNTEDAYNALTWNDERQKPTWLGLQGAWDYMVANYLHLNKKDALNAVFAALPVATRAQLAPLKAAVKVEFEEGNFDLVAEIITQTVVPPELAATKQQLLTILGA